MSDDETGDSLRQRITRQSEDAIGKLAQELLENPLVNSALTRAFDARERAVAAQETALAALNIPSAADVERLTRRVRSVSQRLEGIEDGVDRLDQRLAAMASGGLDGRLDVIDRQLGELADQLTAIRAAVGGAAAKSPAPGRATAKAAPRKAAARKAAAPRKSAAPRSKAG